MLNVHTAECSQFWLQFSCSCKFNRVQMPQLSWTSFGWASQGWMFIVLASVFIQLRIQPCKHASTHLNIVLVTENWLKVGYWWSLSVLHSTSDLSDLICVRQKRNGKMNPKGDVVLNAVAVLGSKTHKRSKEHFLIRRNRTKRANFRCNHLFRATYNTTENS